MLKLKTAAIEKSSHKEYFNIAISVDCVVFCYDQRQLKVLLMKSDFKDFEGLLSLVGELVQPQEDIDDAPYRVLDERVGLKNVFLEQVHTFGTVNRHPSGRVITVAYYSLVDVRNHSLPVSDLEFHWHDVSTIRQLAFDHKIILDYCLQQLRVKVMEYPVVSHLLPEKFSLRELQDLYEAILGVDLDRRNFRKRITAKDWLIDLNEMEEDVPHRPGKLYKLRSALRSGGKVSIRADQKMAV